MTLNKLQISVGNTVEKAHPNATEWEKKAMWTALANAKESEAKDRDALTIIASMEVGDVIKVREVSLHDDLPNIQNVLRSAAKYALKNGGRSCKMMHMTRLFHRYSANDAIQGYNRATGSQLTFTPDERWVLAGFMAENHKDALEDMEKRIRLERNLKAAWSVRNIKKANIAGGGHFFDRDTMALWGDKVRDFERYIENGKVILRNKKNGNEYVFNTETGAIISNRD